jgi:PPOX class probable F420-dependent enzyme
MTTLDAATDAGARALERLGGDTIGWLTSVNPDGQPQSSPVWFLWADGEILVYSRIRAPRNENIRERPLVSFSLNTDLGGDEVVTMEGTARIDPDGPAPSANPAYLGKYLPKIQGYGWTVEYFEANYPVVVRITPTRWRVA